MVPTMFTRLLGGLVLHACGSSQLHCRRSGSGQIWQCPHLRRTGAGVVIAVMGAEASTCPPVGELSPPARSAPGEHPRRNQLLAHRTAPPTGRGHTPVTSAPLACLLLVCGQPRRLRPLVPGPCFGGVRTGGR